MIIGVGNVYRRDDGAGIAAARELAETGIRGVSIVESSGDGTSLMDTWEGAGQVYLIDATASGAPPGAIHRIDAARQTVPARFSHHSTHSVNLAEAIELAKILHRLPPRVTVLGIEGADFRPGTEISPAVQLGIREVVRSIFEELSCTNTL
jgi:hydrogenase maturation protease